MRNVFLYHVLPFFISISCLYGFLKLDVATKVHPGKLDSILTSPNTILLLGSSELTGSDPYGCKPYNFIPANGRFNCVGLGSAGFQSMAMLAKLYPYRHLLKDAKITIIVSPGWFQDDYAYGTSTNIMLQYMSKREFVSCVPKNNQAGNKYTKAIAQWTQNHFHDINNSGSEIKALYYSSYPAWLKNSFLAVPAYTNKLSGGLKSIYFGNAIDHAENGSFYTTPTTETQNKYAIALDSITKRVEVNMLQNCNNPLGVENTIYESEYKGKNKTLRCVPKHVNQELKDFELLLSFLKEQKANVKLVVQSLHPFIYTNLNDLADEMEEVNTLIDRSGFSTLNLYTSEPDQYNKTLLRDAMHMSDYGWIQVNQFILDEYGIEK